MPTQSEFGSGSETSLLLQRACQGDRQAMSDLADRVQRQFREIAANQLRQERPDHTLQTVDLVNEAWLRLIGPADAKWENRRQFFAYVARLMRNALVDHARSRNAIKRGADKTRVDFEVLINCFDEKPLDVPTLIDLQAALEDLERIDDNLARVVDLRCFSGLTIRETADALEVSPARVDRDFRAACCWLRSRLQAHGTEDAPP